MDKFYGYGIVDVHGSCECCFMDRDEAERAASEFDERLQNDAPHRVVELFYKDEDAPVGPIPTLDEMREILNGDSQP